MHASVIVTIYAYWCMGLETSLQSVCLALTQLVSSVLQIRDAFQCLVWWMQFHDREGSKVQC